MFTSTPWAHDLPGNRMEAVKLLPRKMRVHTVTAAHTQFQGICGPLKPYNGSPKLKTFTPKLSDGSYKVKETGMGTGTRNCARGMKTIVAKPHLMFGSLIVSPFC